MNIYHECDLQYEDDEVLKHIFASSSRKLDLSDYTVWPVYIWVITVCLGLSVATISSFEGSTAASIPERIAAISISLGIAVLSAMVCFLLVSSVRFIADMPIILTLLALVSFLIFNAPIDTSPLNNALMAGLYGTIIVLLAYPLAAIGQAAGERWERRKWSPELVVATILANLYEITQGLGTVEGIDDHDRRMEQRRALVKRIDQVARLTKEVLPRLIADGNDWVRQELANRAETIRNWEKQILLPIESDNRSLRDEIIHVMAHILKDEWGSISTTDSPDTHSAWLHRLGRACLVAVTLIPLAFILVAPVLGVVIEPDLRDGLLTLAIPLALIPLAWLGPSRLRGPILEFGTREHRQS